MDPVRDEYDPYPGGENAWGYKVAFQVWMAMFLLTLCAGLANFLGSYFKGLGG